MSAEVRALQLYLFLHIFICALLKAKSAEVALITDRDIVIIEVYYQGCEWDIIV